MTQEEKGFQWTPIVELAITMFTILGTVIPLYINSDSKMETIRQEFAAKIESNRQDALRIQESIKEDMKDFHRQLLEIERSRYKEKQS